MRNIRLVVAYDGTDFFGWQRQPSKPTIQGLLESELTTIVGSKVILAGSGRTDAGVHAAGQVANFKTSCSIPCPNLIKALNDRIPVSVRIKDAAEVLEAFHARYSVVSKTYRYRILLAPLASPFIARFVYQYPYPLDCDAMSQGAAHFKGECDFTSFAASAGGPKTTDREDEAARDFPAHNTRTIFVSRFLWRPKTRLLTYEVKGSGFLRNMVRNLVGTLIEVGRGALDPSQIPAIIAARDRTRAGPTAPAKGLCLWKVEY
ncbi:MAG: tRNA pseudouridine(38-40) synthase TruA [Deltaproteobacteria bacterium]